MLTHVVFGSDGGDDRYTMAMHCMLHAYFCLVAHAHDAHVDGDEDDGVCFWCLLGGPVTRWTAGENASRT